VGMQLKIQLPIIILYGSPCIVTNTGSWVQSKNIDSSKEINKFISPFSQG